MSEIRANTIANAAGTGPAALTGQSASKAWVYADGTATITSSYNVSSSTDAGVGDYEYDMTNTLSDSTGLAAAFGNSVDVTAHLTANPASAVRVRTRGSGSFSDLDHSFCGFGDLA